MLGILCLLLLTTKGWTQIGSDLSCTTASKYAHNAVACDNVFDDDVCSELFLDTNEVLPVEGASTGRPAKCHKDDLLKTTAVQNCAKTCGFCCLTSAYNCTNAVFQALSCDNLTTDNCKDPNLRSIIIQYCPNSCGFCDATGCTDLDDYCQQDKTLCLTNKDFASKYCRRTCMICEPYGTDSTYTLSTSGCVDRNPNCQIWNHNGFCKSDFYTTAEKKQDCAKTCMLC